MKSVYHACALLLLAMRLAYPDEGGRWHREAVVFPAFGQEAILLTGELLWLEREDLAPHRPGVVICHPDPRYGGTMANRVVRRLADTLAGAGMDTYVYAPKDDPLHRRVAANNDRMKEKIAALVQEGINEGSIREDVDPWLFTHEFVGWFLAEDIHCLTDLRDGTFSRSSHLRMLDLILGDVAVPGRLEKKAFVPE